LQRKSQLAIEYCCRTREWSPATWVFWVHASNSTRFEQSYQEIADLVKIAWRRDPKADLFKLVQNWLHDEKNGKWLLILDNLDDASFLFDSRNTSPTTLPGELSSQSSRPLGSYLPWSRNGSILVTTRSRIAASKLVEEREIIRVEPMDEIQAVALFERKVGGHSERKDAAQLVAVLEFMPLAIVQAAAYIKQRAPRCSVRKYTEKFERSEEGKTSLLNYEAGQLRRDYEANNSIVTTWQISFDHINQTRPSAADLLSLMSFFDRQGIPEDLVRGQNNIGDERLETGDKCGEEDNDTDCAAESSINDQFEEDIMTLRNYSFINVTEDTTIFEMHSLVQLATRRWLEAHGQLERWKQQYIKNLRAAFPTGHYENWGKCQALFPHAKSALAQQPESEEILREWAVIQYRAAWYAWEKGSYGDAEKMSVKSMNVRRQLLGQEHRETLDSMEMVSLIYARWARWGEMEELERQVVEFRKRVLGAEHPHTLSSISNLAWTYLNQGR